MSDGSIDLKDAARAEAYATPLEEFHVARPALFQADAMWPFFERLRKEDPVHFSKGDEETGPYWSITRYEDIMTVDTTHQVFSSDAHLGGITIRNFDEDFVLPMFIAMDQPKHDIQRKTVSPIVSPTNLAKLEGIIRERVQRILDSLPIDEPFDWVDRVSIELTTQMLATLFDFPWEERRKLTRWSDIATASPESGIIESEEARRHLSFGFGIHRCVGNRLAEMQLKIVWEEVLKRFPKIEVLEEPKRVYSTFVKGYERMMVRIPERI